MAKYNVKSEEQNGESGKEIKLTGFNPGNINQGADTLHYNDLNGRLSPEPAKITSGIPGKTASRYDNVGHNNPNIRWGKSTRFLSFRS